MSRRKPPVTTFLVALNVAMFAVMVVGGTSPMEPTTAQLLKWGANWGPLSLAGQPWRMLVSNYIHIGVIHILLNMWCLWNLGSLAEQIFDPWTYALIYTVCGLAGSLASLWWHPLVIGAGASGAIFGLAGALIAALYLGHLPIPKEALQGTLKSLLIFAGYNLFFGAVGRAIDNSAHLGGLIAGLALGAVFAKHLMAPPDVRDRWRSGVFVAAALVMFAAYAFVKHASGYVVPLERGVTALQKNSFDEAARALEDVSARKPNDREVLFLLADAYVQKQDYANAESTLQRAMQLDPNNAAAQFNLGFVQLKLRKYDDAIASLNKAIQLNPNNADAEQALAQAYQAKNMPEEARAAMQKANDLSTPPKQH